MKIICALAVLLGLASPAAATQAYTLGPSISTTTGRAAQSLAGTYNLAASSQTISTPTIVMNGATGGINLTSATLSGNTFSVGTSTLVVTGGRVGIGTNSPGSILDVNKGSGISDIRFRSGDNSGVLMRLYDTTGLAYFIDTTNAGRLDIDPSGGGSGITLLTGGNVGIKTSAPGNALDVAGHLRTTAYSAPTTGVGLEIGYTTGLGVVLSINRNTSVYQGIEIDASTITLQVQGKPNAFTIINNGNVGINKTAPTTALDVNGTITATNLAGDGSLITGLTGVTTNSSSTISGQYAYTNVAAQGPSISTANVLYAGGINQAFAVFVTSNAAAVMQYSVGVTSVTYVGTGHYVVTWQHPFQNIFYNRSVNAEVTQGSTTHIACAVNDLSPLSKNMADITCTNQAPANVNPNKVFIMATGAQ